MKEIMIFIKYCGFYDKYNSYGLSNIFLITYLKKTIMIYNILS